MSQKPSLLTLVVGIVFSVVLCVLFIMPIETSAVQSETVSGNETEESVAAEDTVNNYKFVYYRGDFAVIEEYNVISTTEGDDYVMYNLDTGDVLKYENNSWTLWHDNMPTFQYTGTAYMKYIKPN